MNPARPTFSPEADEQASLWAARLDGSTLSATDRTALETWLAADASHRSLLSSYCQFSADLERELAARAIPAPETASPAWWRRQSAVVTLVAAAAAVVFALWIAAPGGQHEDFTAAIAQRQTVALSDGTRVELNAQTSLSVDFRRAERRVRLSGGEAFFTVAKDPSRPFIVETPGGSVRVTGTVFNVRADAQASFEVTVVEGSVLVRPTADTAEPYALKANDQFSQGHVTHIPTDAVEVALAWRQGRVVFADTPLPDAVARFARYHGRKIVVTPEAARQVAPGVGGSFTLSDLDGFLASLKENFAVRIEHPADGSILITARQ